MPFGSTNTTAKLIQAGREGCRINRRVQRLESGILRLDQEIRVTGQQSGLDVTGRFWMFATVHIKRGTIEYLSGNNRIAPPSPFYGIFVPPYSLVEVALDRSDSYSRALVSAKRLSAEIPNEPIVFGIKSPQCPDSILDMAGLVDAAPKIMNVERCARPPVLALRVKEAIDAGYTFPMPLSEIAASLRISPATMSRCFKKVYGMPPIRYRHILRTMDGMMRLLDGGAIADVFQEVGFDDLSRFYRHFKQYMLAPPATYRL